MALRNSLRRICGITTLQLRTGRSPFPVAYYGRYCPASSLPNLIDSKVGQTLHGGRLLNGVRPFSSMSSLLETEISEADAEAGDFEAIDQYLSGTDFKLHSRGAEKDPEVVLENGNTVVRFDPGEFEHSGDESAIPLVAIVKTDKKQLTFACLARRDEGTGDGGIEIEDICIEPLGGLPDDSEAYSPAIGELSDEFKDELFAFLADRGVHDEFAGELLFLAGKLETKLYADWLREMKSFFEEEEAM